MIGCKDKLGSFVKGIEEYISDSQHRTENHINVVVKDILENYVMFSHNKKFHAT